MSERARWRGRRAVIALGSLSFACTSPSEPSAQRAEADRLESTEPLLPLPTRVDVDRSLAQLGKSLFFDTILSGDGRVSCGSCHAPEHGLSDATARSEPPGRSPTPTNSTTLFNVRFFFKLGWSARFDSLEEHLDWLIANPNLMATSWSAVAERLKGAPLWNARFAAVFVDGVTTENARRALLEYERSLVTPNAPFDRWLRGDRSRLSPDAERGYRLFKEYGCASCHQGMSVGANSLQRFGVMKDYFEDHPEQGDGDRGRMNVTRSEDDRHVFRVPSLRNVALTAPYFHDGSAKTLEQAVSTMARYQLGRDLESGDIASIVGFLRSLTGEYEGRPL